MLKFVVFLALGDIMKFVGPMVIHKGWSGWLGQSKTLSLSYMSLRKDDHNIGSLHIPSAPKHAKLSCDVKASSTIDVMCDVYIVVPSNPPPLLPKRCPKKFMMHGLKFSEVVVKIVDKKKCIVCSQMKDHEVSMGAKSDTSEIHDDKRQAK